MILPKNLKLYPIGTIDLGKALWYCEDCKLDSFTGERFEHNCKGK